MYRFVSRLFFRRHYPVNTVTYCGVDPQERRWTQKMEDGHALSSKYVLLVLCKQLCCQCRRYDNSAMTLEILFSLKTMESLKNGLQPQSEVTPLFSMRTALLVSSKSCCSVDADPWCKWALKSRLYLTVDTVVGRLGSLIFSNYKTLHRYHKNHRIGNSFEFSTTLYIFLQK